MQIEARYTVEIISKDGRAYMRTESGYWSVERGESWEPVYGEKEEALEAEYQALGHNNGSQ